MSVGSLYAIRTDETIRTKALVIAAALAAVFMVNVNSHARTPVTYAGFAYAGDFADMKLNYPITYELSKTPSSSNPDVPLLDALLLSRLARNMPGGIDLNTSEAGRIESGHTVALAFVLYRESLSVEQFTDGFKVVANLGAQAFFYDVEEKTCIASYPLNVQYIDFPDSLPDSQYKLQTIRSLYEDDDLNIFDDFVMQIHDVQLEEMTGNRLGISKVGIIRRALKHIPPALAENIDNLKDILANHLSMSFTHNQQVSILPYSSAVDGKMRIHFGDASQFTELFTIPQPDYHIELVLDGFIKQLEQKKSAEKLYLYGAFVRIKVFHPDSSTNYLDESFKNGNAVSVPASQLQESDWPVFEETLLDLFDKLTAQFTDPKRSWVESSIYKQPNKPRPKVSSVIKQMRNVKGVLDKCR